ncbi:CocE/NonD family hydrolase [Planosporangium thailandense]|uniref:CocE/NonD family hydrolase n=1 Tax=Planosporangium thailandense TaxID=765197 RepID=A0ABX0XYJ0_9ACTN|nr:CocE/NonD family hydrolase [Planosporangium thailandense]NJC70957.1 CocE/NonD family hydrolase [Planosporangium thailandense]
MALRRSAVLSAVLAGVTTVTLSAPAPASAAVAAHRAAAARSAATAESTPITGFRFVDIPAKDGVVLKANVVAPTTAGRHPAIVFVNSWGLNDLQYLAQARAFASRGYVVLSYTTRGFWDSGGEIDVAGPKDVADASSVVDWLLANTAADPAHLGIAGVSYGSGISLLASAFDPRIKAVVAMSCWTDLVTSLYGNDTRRPQTVWLLKTVAQLVGRPSAEFSAMAKAYLDSGNTDVEPLKAWGRVRSPDTYLDAINRNHPAILMANAYGDSLFAPNQLVDFYGKLTGPKRLEFAPGDHAVVEGLGLFGLPNHVWDSAYRWFDRYLAGKPTGIDTEPPVVLRHLGSDAVESYADWAHVTTSTQRMYLGGAHWWDGTGPMSTSAPGAWSESISMGTDTVAGAGIPLLTNGLTGLTGIAPTVWLPLINRNNAAVWESDPLPANEAIRGCPTLHLAVNSAASTGTLVAYLYDAGPLAFGKLIAQAPITWLASTRTIDLKLEAMADDIPAGHHLALVIDTKDPLYMDADQAGATVSFGSGSWLDVTLR